VAGIIHAIESIKEKTLEAERSLNQMSAVLVATGNAAGLTKEELSSLAEEVSGKSIFDVDQIRTAETALLRFRTVQKGVFEDALRLAPDVAAALNTDLPSGSASHRPRANGPGTRHARAARGRLEVERSANRPGDEVC
jgi:hypothetical protein